MKLQRLWNEIRFLASMVVLVALVQSCAGEQSASDDEPQIAQNPASAGDVVARGDYVLCPAIEGIADDLAARVGFQRDPERSIAGIGAECFVRAMDFGWIRVAIPPAMIRTIGMQAEGYESPSSPAPELGENAVFVNAQLQPHVIFELLGQIIDVGVEHAGTGAPDRATVIAVAEMVRDALRGANSG